MALSIVLRAVSVTEVSTPFMYFWHQTGNTVCGLLEFCSRKRQAAGTKHLTMKSVQIYCSGMRRFKLQIFRHCA